MSNYVQILDGIDDQIADLIACQTNYVNQISNIQAELDKIPGQIEALQALKASTEALSANAIDLNINLNVNGSNYRTVSTKVG